MNKPNTNKCSHILFYLSTLYRTRLSAGGKKITLINKLQLSHHIVKLNGNAEYGIKL